MERASRRRWRRGALIGLPALLLAWLALGYVAAAHVCRRHPATIPAATRIAGRAVHEVEFTTTDGVELSAWWIPGDESRTVIICHGIVGDRRAGRQRAAVYLDRGWSVLLPDLRGHGQSGGDTVSFGWHEKLDVAAARTFARRRGAERIGVHGISLGAAAIVYGLPPAPDDAFMVLESCYDDIENAFRHRMASYPVPGFALWPMRQFIRWRIGAAEHELVPAHHIRRATAPTLVLAGDCEQQLPAAETENLFAACGSPTKVLHLFEGATHQDIERYAPQEYRRILGAFLDRL